MHSTMVAANDTNGNRAIRFAHLPTVVNHTDTIVFDNNKTAELSANSNNNITALKSLQISQKVMK